MMRDLALGRLPAGALNKTEAAYAQHLELQKRAGLIRAYAFEALTFKLANDTRYTPDFMVLTADRVIELHEVKGFWRDDALVKVKVAAAQHPWFVFKAVRKEKAGWEITEVKP